MEIKFVCISECNCVTTQKKKKFWLDKVKKKKRISVVLRWLMFKFTPSISYEEVWYLKLKFCLFDNIIISTYAVSIIYAFCKRFSLLCDFASRSWNSHAPIRSSQEARYLVTSEAKSLGHNDYDVRRSSVYQRWEWERRWFIRTDTEHHCTVETLKCS